MSKKTDHNPVLLTEAQAADFNQMRTALDDHYTKLNALLGSAFKNEVEDRAIQFAGGIIMMPFPTGKIRACPHCLSMLVHMLRETADVFEDVGRKLELPVSNFQPDWLNK